jgi:hypothetical protein
MTGPFIFIATNPLKHRKLDSEKKRLPDLVDFVQAPPSARPAPTPTRSRRPRTSRSAMLAVVALDPICPARTTAPHDHLPHLEQPAPVLEAIHRFAA